MLSKNKIKFLKSLQSKKSRDEHYLFVVEGEKGVSELLQNQENLLQEIYYTAAFHAQDFMFEKWIGGLISEQELKQISGLKTPNKIFAVCKQFDYEWQDFPFVLALDDIQDPGNLGTLIRLADWYGVEAIVCSKNSVDCYNPKVVQATMGSLFRVKLFYTDLSNFLKEQDKCIYGAVMHGENVYDKKLQAEGVLVLGNEGNGISHEIQALLQEKITIPKKGNAESLNVGTAGAILLSEFFRGSF